MALRLGLLAVLAGDAHAAASLPLELYGAGDAGLADNVSLDCYDGERVHVSRGLAEKVEGSGNYRTWYFDVEGSSAALDSIVSLNIVELARLNITPPDTVDV